MFDFDIRNKFTAIRCRDGLSKGCYLKISIYIAAYRFRACTQCMYIDRRIGAKKGWKLQTASDKAMVGRNMTRENTFLTSNTVVPFAQLVSLNALEARNGKKTPRECEIHISYMFYTSYARKWDDL